MTVKLAGAIAEIVSAVFVSQSSSILKDTTSFGNQFMCIVGADI